MDNFVAFFGELSVLCHFTNNIHKQLVHSQYRFVVGKCKVNPKLWRSLVSCPCCFILRSLKGQHHDS